MAICEKKTCGWRNMIRIIELWAEICEHGLLAAHRSESLSGVCWGTEPGAFLPSPLSLLSFTAIYRFRRHAALSPCLGIMGDRARSTLCLPLPLRSITVVTLLDFVSFDPPECFWFIQAAGRSSGGRKLPTRPFCVCFF